MVDCDSITLIGMLIFYRKQRQYCPIIKFYMPIAKTKIKKIKKGRDAETGQYVPLAYAKAHPSTTVIETDKIKVKKK